MIKYKWPKKSIYWLENKTLNITIPFTWELPKVYSKVKRLPLTLYWTNVIVGGPAVELIPGYFDKVDHVIEGHNCPGVLQKINPFATRTTLGCIRKCKFCAIGSGKIEGKFKELSDYPDLPIICDNNLLAASKKHFNKVIDRLKIHNQADFNQGLDSRLLTDFHAKRISEIKEPVIRLALDHLDYKQQWLNAFNCLRDAGIAKRKISSYCLIAFNSNPKEAWQRCQWVESHGVLAYPMWYHELDALKKNIVTSKQSNLGWTEKDRLHIMGYYYKHRGHPPK